MSVVPVIRLEVPIEMHCAVVYTANNRPIGTSEVNSSPNLVLLLNQLHLLDSVILH